MSRPSRRSSFTVLTNLASMLRVKLWPGFSDRMRISIIELYCTVPDVFEGLDRYLRIRTAASLDALALDSAASTMAGRWTYSVEVWLGPVPDSQNAFISRATMASGVSPPGGGGESLPCVCEGELTRLCRPENMRFMAADDFS